MMATMTDLRHITSIPNLAASQRLSQHLRTSPARSPSSIPSSPTSVHSSSSAIFERDIEPLSPPSPQSYGSHNHHLHHPTDPHRIPRSKTTEQIEHSVPSVLDSAAAILASVPGTNDVSIVAPAPFGGSPLASSGFASPIGSFGSRSPSPTAIHGRNSLLLSIPQQQQQQHAPGSLSGSPPRQSSMVRPTPTIQTTNVASSTTTSSIVTPTSAYFSVADDSESASGLSDIADQTMTAIRDLPDPLPTITTPQYTLSPAPSSPTSLASAATATKRLSFLSYGDLLTSIPTSTLSLSSLTTAASVIEPPPHITGVAVPSTNHTFSSHSGSTNTSLRGFPISLPGCNSNGAGTNNNGMYVASDAFGPLVPLVPVPVKKDSGGMPALDDVVGGEWEREGLGKGLEERLDVLYGTA